MRRALADIDDATVGERLGYRSATRRVGAFTPDDEPLLVSIEPDAGYAAQQNTAPHHPLDEFVIDPEPLDTQFAFGAVDDPYFADDYAFDDRFEAALGSGYDDGGYDTRVGYDDDGDRIVIIDDSLRGGAMPPGRPRPRAGGFPPNRTFGDEERRASPLTWLFVLAAMVLVFALVLSKCGDGGKKLATSTSTTLAPSVQTAALGASGTVANSPTGTTPAAPTIPVTTAGGAVSGVRTPTTWVIYFAVNSTTIDSAGQQVITQVAERLRTSGVGTPVVITGYSDTSGNPTANQQLSLARASVVRDAISAAVPQAAAKFSVESKGDTQPEADPAKSRRVTVTVS